MVNVGFIFQSRGASGNEFLLKIILTHHALRHLNVKLATIITCSVFFVQFSSLKSWQHFHQPEVGPGWKREDLQTSLPFMTWGPTCLDKTKSSHLDPESFFFFGVFRCETLQHRQWALMAAILIHLASWPSLFLGISPWNITASSPRSPEKHRARWVNWLEENNGACNTLRFCFPKGLGSWTSTMVDHAKPLLK